MSLAAETRAAVRARPFLLEALRAGVVNYTAAARYLDVGDETAVAAALRRYAEDLPAPDPDAEGGTRVSMRSDLGRTDDPEAALLVAGDAAFAPGEGEATAILAEGDVGTGSLGHVLRRLAVADVEAIAAATAGGALLVVVPRRSGADALRTVEAVLG